MDKIIWGAPTPTFGRLSHAFKLKEDYTLVGRRSLCGRFENTQAGQIDRTPRLSCAACRKIVNQMSDNRTEETRSREKLCPLESQKMKPVGLAVATNDRNSGLNPLSISNGQPNMKGKRT